jgi:hypothetical protein
MINLIVYYIRSLLARLVFHFNNYLLFILNFSSSNYNRYFYDNYIVENNRIINFLYDFLFL